MFLFFSFLESRVDLAQKTFEYWVVQTLISSRNKVWVDSGNKMLVAPAILGLISYRWKLKLKPPTFICCSFVFVVIPYSLNFVSYKLWCITVSIVWMKQTKRSWPCGPRPLCGTASIGIILVSINSILF